ncbi:MAG: RdgB/HAM1 family non-canonical purine NTP pyrophosphatase [Patescibacteria group bacterium]
MNLIIATHNPGKFSEIRSLLSSGRFNVLSADEVGYHIAPNENGSTLVQNALIKARTVAAEINEWVLAEDTGLFVDCLGGNPGINSARWAGDNAADEQIRDFLLQKMKQYAEKERTASFTSIVALISPNKEEFIFSGNIAGTIALKPAGKIRFHLPYDQVFIPKNCKKTFSELSDREKDSISHRGIVFKKVRTFLAQQYG